MQYQRLAKQGQLRRAEFILAVVTDQQVLHQSLVVARKTFDAFHPLSHLLES